MNFEDTARVIASYLDNQTLEKIFLSGAMPSLLNMSLDQNFWHARVETLSGRRFQFRDTNWRETYYILDNELRSEEPFFSRDARHSQVLMWNEEDNVLVLEILLSLGYHPSEEALSLAAQGEIEILKFLLQEGSINPEVSVSSEKCLLPLTEAARAGHVEAVRLLLSDPRVDPNLAEVDYTALGEACAASGEGKVEDYCEIIRLLLADSRVDPRNVECLDLACRLDDNVEAVRILLADYRIVPDNRSIILGAMMGREKIVALLLQDRRINPAAEYNKPLREAIEREHINVVRILLADPRVDPRYGHILNIAIASGNTEIIDLLLQDGRIDQDERELARTRLKKR